MRGQAALAVVRASLARQTGSLFAVFRLVVFDFPVLSRRFLGTEVSPNYVEGIRRRLDGARPIAARPAAKSGARWPDDHLRELQGTYAQEGVATDLLQKHPHLLAAFAAHLNLRLQNAGVEGEYRPRDVWVQLEKLRKTARLPKVKVHATERPVGRVRPLGRTMFD